MRSYVWEPSELHASFVVSKTFLADVMEQFLDAVAVPHQHICSLSPLLGKPNGAFRTICKTRLLYRMALRADD